MCLLVQWWFLVWSLLIVHWVLQGFVLFVRPKTITHCWLMAWGFRDLPVPCVQLVCLSHQHWRLLNNPSCVFVEHTC